MSELHCGLHVLFWTCDGTSAKRKCFQVYSIETEDDLFAFDDRKIFFISEAPYLMETAANCFAKSFPRQLRFHSGYILTN